MRVIGWHLLVVDKQSPPGWVSGVNIPTQFSRGEMGREEHSVRGATYEFKAWKTSTPSSRRCFRDSARDISVSLHRVREAFGIFFSCFWREADIGKVLDPMAAECHLSAAERIFLRDPSLPRTRSVFVRCQTDVESSNVSRFDQKCG